MPPTQEQPDKPVTAMLQLAAKGDAAAAAEILPLLYGELRQLAEARMRKTPPGHTLQPTALVHEAYMRLVGESDPGWEGRGHFFFAASRAMRDILIERARSKASLKKGGDRKRVDVENFTLATEVDAENLLALDAALQNLKAKSQRQYDLVVLRYFGGLTLAEAAIAMGVNERTLRRDLAYVRARLHRDLGGHIDEDTAGHE